jgi:hypothetical protein
MPNIKVSEHLDKRGVKVKVTLTEINLEKLNCRNGDGS